MNFQANNYTSYQLIQESYQCNFTVSKTSPNQVTISWNVPLDANTTTNQIAYNGLIIVASDTDQTFKPVNGTIYNYDPTTNVDLHVGDKIGDGLVVFSVYDDKATITCNINSDFDPYLYAYIVDRHNRYIPFPIILSSRDFLKRTSLPGDSQGTALLEIFNRSITDLIEWSPSPTPTETLEFCYGFPPTNVTYTYSTAGLTYQAFIDQFNTYAKQQSANFINNIPFNTGTYWLNDDIAISWDGYVYNPHITIVQATQPHIVADGTVWKDSVGVFKLRSDPLWNTISVLNKPTINTTTADYWYNQTLCYKWEGNVWVELPTYIQPSEPGVPLYDQLDGTYWLDSVNMVLYHIDQSRLVKKNAITYDTDPALIPVGTHWVDNKNKTVKELTNLGWTTHTSTFGTNCNLSELTTRMFFDTINQQLFDLVLDVEITNFIQYPTDPLTLPNYTLWYNPTLSELKIRNSSAWVDCELLISENNPLITEDVPDESVWVNGTVIKIKQGTWENIAPIVSLTDPNILINGQYVYETTTDKIYQFVSPSTFNLLPLITSISDPAIPIVGEFWLNGLSLFMWNGAAYVPIIYTTTDPKPTTGFKWYQPSTDKLFIWNGFEYEETDPIYQMNWNNGLELQHTLFGSESVIAYKEYVPINGKIISPVTGNDSVSSQRMQVEQNIGGNEDDVTERRNLIEYVKRTLGAPTNVVELSEMQINDCIDSALRTLRLYASVSTDKKVTLMELIPSQSTYTLSNRRLGYHKITEILQIHRLPSAFLTAVGSQQVYGQLVLQQLYRAGSFDLLSYHLVANYIELMERMFASKINFTWKERNRELTIYNTTGRKELVLIECTVERTENDLMTDRRTEDWIKRWTVAESQERLSEIRGKFATLPGAGGGISLNASDLHQKSIEAKERCINEIKTYVVDSPEYFGGHSTFIMG